MINVIQLFNDQRHPVIW